MSADRAPDGNNNLEVEVKLLVPDLDAFRRRLVTGGGHQVRPRVFERNLRFDNAWDSLMRNGQLLRLRQDTAARLTFKGIPAGIVESEAKVREELEVSVDNFAMTAAILERLGFTVKQVYEKYREAFQLGTVEVVLDEMPFGDFVELEGEEAAIRSAAERLGLEWRLRILDNYLLLMARLKAHHNLPFDDLTFANFAGRDVSVADLYRET